MEEQQRSRCWGCCSQSHKICVSYTGIMKSTCSIVDKGVYAVVKVCKAILRGESNPETAGCQQSHPLEMASYHVACPKVYSCAKALLMVRQRHIANKVCIVGTVIMMITAVFCEVMSVQPRVDCVAVLNMPYNDPQGSYCAHGVKPNVKVGQPQLMFSRHPTVRPGLTRLPLTCSVARLQRKRCHCHMRSKTERIWRSAGRRNRSDRARYRSTSHWMGRCSPCALSVMLCNATTRLLLIVSKQAQEHVE
jgi:hypothetical protein